MTVDVANNVSRSFLAFSQSTYDFSPFYTTLPHNLIRDKLVDLIVIIFQREGSLNIVYNDRHAFFTSDAVSNDNLSLIKSVWCSHLSLRQ